MVLFFYDTRQYGLVRVSMSIDTLTAEQRRLDSMEGVARNDDPNTCGEVELNTIRGGTEAILGYPSDRSVNISWREGPVLISVGGPTLTPEKVIEIGEYL